MPEIKLEQATFRINRNGTPTLSASSPGWKQDWNADIHSYIIDYGFPPVGISCPKAIFAQPFGKEYVLIGQLTDRPGSTEKVIDVLGFHIIILSRKEYEFYLQDPFYIAAKFVPDWHATTLPTISLPQETPPKRTIEQVRSVLQRLKPGHEKPEAQEFDEEPGKDEDKENDDADQEEQIEQENQLIEASESPALLGGVQVIVDGGKVVFERDTADTDLIQSLWLLLPESTRCEVWPATFAFNNNIPFELLVVPRLRLEEFPGYVTEEQAADYPEGSYELNLQYAVEHGNQDELDALFRRRSFQQTWKMAWTILVVMAVFFALSNWVFPPLTPPSPRRDHRPATRTVGLVGMSDPLGMVLYVGATDELRKKSNSARNNGE